MGGTIIDMVATNVGDYSWVDPRYLGIPSKFIERDGVPFEVWSFPDWKILAVHIDKMIFHTFEGCSVPFYSCIFEK